MKRVLMLLDLTFSFLATSYTYKASLTGSTWQHEDDVFLCCLSHDTPEFGQAKFLARGGDRVRFHLDSFQQLLGKSRVRDPRVESNEPSNPCFASTSALKKNLEKGNAVK